MAVSLPSLPIAGWQGRLILEDFTVREDGSTFQLDPTSDETSKLMTLVQNVNVNGDFSVLTEPTLGSRIKVVIPTPIEFSGSFEIIQSQENTWVNKVLLGKGLEHRPIHFTLVIATIEDELNVGYIFKECYMRRFQNITSANGTVRTRIEFVALNMEQYYSSETEIES